MNNIQNYGTVNYQTSFCSKRKAVKTLTGNMTERQLKAKFEEVYDKLPKLTCNCPAGKNINMDEGVIRIIG